jgi:hypothetical protein
VEDPLVLADPVLPDTVLPDPVPVPPDPVLPDTVPSDPVLTPAPAAGGVLSVGLVPVALEAGVLDGGDTDVEELPLAGVVAVAVTGGVAVLDGGGELGGQGVLVALDFAEAVEVTVLTAVAVAVPVAVAVAVPVAVALALSLGLLLLVLALGWLLTEFAGDALGDAELVDLAAADDELDGHTVTCALLGAAELVPWLPPPAAEPGWLADPLRLGASWPGLELEIPTAEPSWTKAWRSGGSASATPMANTAHAAATAGRSHPYRQSRSCRSPSPAASCPPRKAFQRRVTPARKPPPTAACLLAWADPELTRARMRSSPSGPGSS